MNTVILHSHLKSAVFSILTSICRLIDHCYSKRISKPTFVDYASAIRNVFRFCMSTRLPCALRYIVTTHFRNATSGRIYDTYRRIRRKTVPQIKSYMGAL